MIGRGARHALDRRPVGRQRRGERGRLLGAVHVAAGDETPPAPRARARRGRRWLQLLCDPLVHGSRTVARHGQGTARGRSRPRLRTGGHRRHLPALRAPRRARRAVVLSGRRDAGLHEAVLLLPRSRRRHERARRRRRRHLPPGRRVPPRVHRPPRADRPAAGRPRQGGRAGLRRDRARARHAPRRLRHRRRRHRSPPPRPRASAWTTRTSTTWPTRWTRFPRERDRSAHARRRRADRRGDRGPARRLPRRRAALARPRALRRAPAGRRSATPSPARSAPPPPAASRCGSPTTPTTTAPASRCRRRRARSRRARVARRAGARRSPARPTSCTTSTSSATAPRCGPGSTNWTLDSWTREENVIVTVESRASRARPTRTTSRSSGRAGASRTAARFDAAPRRRRRRDRARVVLARARRGALAPHRRGDRRAPSGACGSPRRC